MNAKCITYNGHMGYLTVGKVYEVLGRSRSEGKAYLRVYCDHSNIQLNFSVSWFELTREPVTPRFPFRVRCKFNYIWVFPLGGGHYQRSLSDRITVGNVYEVIEINIRGDYVMLTDHGTRTQELPCENFEVTQEPVTPNPLREKEEADMIAQQRQDFEYMERAQQEQSLRDSMDQYYNPKAYYARQEAKEARVRALQQVFVCGLPYSN